MFRRDKKRCVGTECGWKMWNTNIAMWRCEATIRHQPSRGSRAVRRFNRANHCLDYSNTQKCRRNATVAIWERGDGLFVKWNPMGIWGVRVFGNGRSHHKKCQSKGSKVALGNVYGLCWVDRMKCILQV